MVNILNSEAANQASAATKRASDLARPAKKVQRPWRWLLLGAAAALSGGIVFSQPAVAQDTTKTTLAWTIT